MKHYSDVQFKNQGKCVRPWRICSNIMKYYETLENIMKYDETLENIMKYDETL